MNDEPNQARDVHTAVHDHGPIDAESIARRTRWNRHVVDVALEIMVENAMVARAERADGEPVYRALFGPW